MLSSRYRREEPRAIQVRPSNELRKILMCQIFLIGSGSANRTAVSTVGRDEEVIRKYIRNQGAEDQRLEQMNLWR
jgi:hypothetical protein